MKVVVDFDLCQSNGICQAMAPDVFEVRDDGYLHVLQENPDESLRLDVESAANSCPVQAITIEG